MIKTLSAIPINQLVERLKKSSYAFAMWQLPEQSSSQLIVSLHEITQSRDSLNDLDSGFLINTFKDNHPVHPYHITADIIFSDEEVSIAPHIGAKEVDDFLQFVNSEHLDSVEKIGIDNTLDSSGLSESFEEKVTLAINEIEKGTFEKVVLARAEDIKIPQNFNLMEFYKKVCISYPNAFCSLVHIPKLGIWIGASPELLVHQDSNEFHTISLAGTKRMDPEIHLNEIAWTQKEIEEQAFVSRYVINCFKKLRLREFREHGPKTVQAGNLAHLKTDYSVNLKEVGMDDLADQMLKLLHPTSAVCGMPMDVSQKFILNNEGFKREFFTGFLGPVNFKNSTQLFVNLRCMKIQNGWTRLYAGAGITEDSKPERELNETELKIATMKSLII